MGEIEKLLEELESKESDSSKSLFDSIDKDLEDLMFEEEEAYADSLDESLSGLVEDFEQLEEKSIVKLDKKDKKHVLTVKKAIMLAKEKNDPLYKMYAKAASAKKIGMSKMLQKYGNAAKGIVLKDFK